MGMAVKKQKGKKPDAPAPKRPAEKRMEPQTVVDGKEIRGIVRMSGRDLKGHLKLIRALRAIRGIGHSVGKLVANAAIEKLKLKPSVLIGELSEEEIEKLEELILNIHKCGLSNFMLNRQKSYQDGKPVHMIGTDLQYAVKQDVEHEQDSQTWKGFRHSYGQKVRGQRTRSTGRKGMTVGVMRKAVKAASAPASAPAAKDSKAQKK